MGAGFSQSGEIEAAGCPPVVAVAVSTQYGGGPPQYTVQAGAMSGWTGLPLRGVWGSSGNDVFAVGDAGTILHYNGFTWSAVSSGTTRNLAGVWVSPGRNAFAVGDSGTVLRYGPQ